MRKIRFGIIGLVDDHVWPVWGEGYIEQVVKCDKAELIAAADDHDELLQRIKNEYGVEKLYKSYEEMLDKEKVDAILLSVPNDERAELTEVIASRGIHIQSDKPMAVTLKQANRMKDIVRKTGIKMIVNWRIAWNPGFQRAMSLIQDGAIGDVYQVRHESANSGPENHGCSKYFLEWLFSRKKNGGGALMDYCCYGAAICISIKGKPGSVIGLAGKYVKKDLEAEDNAILLLEYSDGIGIVEGSWSQYGVDTQKDIYPLHGKTVICGSNGAIVINAITETDLKPIGLLNKENRAGRAYEVEPLANERKNAIEYLVHCINNDEAVQGVCSAESSRDVQEIIEAGYLSIEEGRKISLPLSE